MTAVKQSSHEDNCCHVVLIVVTSNEPRLLVPLLRNKKCKAFLPLFPCHSLCTTIQRRRVFQSSHPLRAGQRGGALHDPAAPQPHGRRHVSLSSWPPACNMNIHDHTTRDSKQLSLVTHTQPAYNTTPRCSKEAVRRAQQKSLHLIANRLQTAWSYSNV